MPDLQTVLETAATELLIPTNFALRMSDFHGLYGGTTFRVFGAHRPEAGKLEIEEVDRVKRTTTRTRPLPDEALLELIGLLVAARVWDESLPDRMPVAGETLVTIAVEAGGASGHRFELQRDWESAERLVRVWRWLEAHAT